VVQEIKVTVRTCDVIVMSTDGLFDNVHNIELEKLERDGLGFARTGNILEKLFMWIRRIIVLSGIF